MAPAAPASMRSFSVSSERISSQAVCGSHIVPSVERMRRTGASIAFAPEAPPAMRSEWPPMYLVREVTTIRRIRTEFGNEGNAFAARSRMIVRRGVGDDQVAASHALDSS